MNAADPPISIIIPLLNESPSLPQLYENIVGVMHRDPAADYEIIFADDGSTDGSWEIISRFREQDERVNAVRLAQHTGKTAAMKAGMEAARGTTFIFMDADLQNDANDIPQFLAALQGDAALVLGRRRQRQDSYPKNVLSHIFNGVIRCATGMGLHDNNCGFKAAQARALTEVRLLDGLHRFLPVLVAMEGYTVHEIGISHLPRLHGKSRYGLMRYFHAVRDLAIVLAVAAMHPRPSAIRIRARSIAAICAVLWVGFLAILPATQAIAMMAGGLALAAWLYRRQRAYFGASASNDKHADGGSEH